MPTLATLQEYAGSDKHRALVDVVNPRLVNDCMQHRHYDLGLHLLRTINDVALHHCHHLHSDPQSSPGPGRNVNSLDVSGDSTGDQVAAKTYQLYIYWYFGIVGTVQPQKRLVEY